MLQEYFNTHKDEKIVEFASHTLNHLFEQKTGVPIDTPVTPEYKLKIISEIINKGYKPDSNDKFFIDSLKKDIKKVKQFEPIVTVKRINDEIVQKKPKKSKPKQTLKDMDYMDKALSVQSKALKEHYEHLKETMPKKARKRTMTTKNIVKEIEKVIKHADQIVKKERRKRLTDEQIKAYYDIHGELPRTVSGRKMTTTIDKVIARLEKKASKGTKQPRTRKTKVQQVKEEVKKVEVLPEAMAATELQKAITEVYQGARFLRDASEGIVNSTDVLKKHYESKITSGMDKIKSILESGVLSDVKIQEIKKKSNWDRMIKMIT